MQSDGLCLSHKFFKVEHKYTDSVETSNPGLQLRAVGIVGLQTIVWFKAVLEKKSLRYSVLS